jgi:hypothetical protein
VRFDVDRLALESARETLRCSEVTLVSRGERVWEASGCGRSIGIACSAHNEPRCTGVRWARTSTNEARTAPRTAATHAVAETQGARPVAASPTMTTRAPIDVSTEAASASQGIPPTGAPPPSDADARAAEVAAATVRASLDARRQDILACAGRDRVVVRVAWENGRVAVALGGELAGSPEEGCVRAALADLPAPDGAPHGVILHLLRR